MMEAEGSWSNFVLHRTHCQAAFTQTRV